MWRDTSHHLPHIPTAKREQRAGVGGHNVLFGGRIHVELKRGTTGDGTGGTTGDRTGDGTGDRTGDRTGGRAVGADGAVRCSVFVALRGRFVCLACLFVMAKREC